MLRKSSVPPLDPHLPEVPSDTGHSRVDPVRSLCMGKQQPVFLDTAANHEAFCDTTGCRQASQVAPVADAHRVASRRSTHRRVSDLASALTLTPPTRTRTP